MEDLIFCNGCKKWFVIGDTATVFDYVKKDSIDPPVDKDFCKGCGYDLTDDKESYDSTDIIELLNNNNIVPEV